MPDYTYLNNVPVARVHKCNASDVREDASHMIEYYERRLLILAAMAPANIDEGDGPIPWDNYINREIPGILEELKDSIIKEFLSNYIVENPDECDDELERELSDNNT
jgi:hypothetical protein